MNCKKCGCPLMLHDNPEIVPQQYSCVNIECDENNIVKTERSENVETRNNRNN